MTIRFSLFLPAALLLAISLGACSDKAAQTPKEVSASDGAYHLTVTDAYVDQMAQKEAIVAAYMPGLPAEQLTLLQIQGKPEAGKMVYGSHMPIPEGNTFSMQQLAKQVEVVSNSIERVQDIRFHEIADTDTEASYVLTTTFGDTVAYEACRMAIATAQLFTVCARTTDVNEVAAAEQMMDSLIFD